MQGPTKILSYFQMKKKCPEDTTWSDLTKLISQFSMILTIDNPWIGQWASYGILFDQSYRLIKVWSMFCHLHIAGILPKGPHLPCVSMAGRALLAGYHQYVVCDMLLYYMILHCGTIIVLVNFLHIPHKSHLIAHPLGQAMRCPLWIQILIYILLQSLQRCMQYHVILDRVLMAMDCIWRSNLFSLHYHRSCLDNIF